MLLVEYILKVSNVLFTASLYPNSMTYKLLTVLALLIYEAGLFINSIYNFEYSQPPLTRLNIYSIVVLNLTHICQGLFVLSMAVPNIFVYPNWIGEIIKNLKKFDADMNYVNFLEKSVLFWSLFVFVVILHPVFSCQQFFAALVMKNVGWYWMKFYIVVFIVPYTISIGIFLESWLIVEVFIRFKFLNKSLKTVSTRCNDLNINNFCKELKKQINVLSDASLRINKLFGVANLLFTIYFILQLIHYSYNIVYQYIHSSVFRVDYRVSQIIAFSYCAVSNNKLS